MKYLMWQGQILQPFQFQDDYNILYLINDQNQIQMFILITLILALIGFYYYYVYIFRPKKIMKWYHYTLEALGYNVLLFPYQPFKIIMLQNQKYNQQQYGDAFYDQKFNWQKYDIILTNNSYMITLILINPRLIKYFFAPDINPYFYKSSINKVGFTMALGKTMILAEGQTWKNKRKIISQIFNFQFIKRNIPKMKQICEQILQKMQKKMQNISQNNTIIKFKTQLLPTIEQIISNIVVRCFFGNKTLNQTIDNIPINQYLSSILAQSKRQSTDFMVIAFGEKAYKYGILPKYRKLNNKLKKLKDAVKKIIQRRIQQLKDGVSPQNYTDIFEAMWYLKNNKPNKANLDLNQIIEEFCAFMAAGNDSTSIFTNMVMYYIHQNPQVEKKLRSKINQNFKSMKDVTFQKIRDIDYLQWVLMETNRMYGPATSIMLRQATRDIGIDNIPIMKGTGIKIELLPNHYNQKYFKNPNKFDPLRWFDEQEHENYSYGGFSFGARTCIGKHLAYLSCKIIIIALLMRYQKIQIENSDKIIFQLKSFYSPSTFQSIFTKKTDSL